MSISQSENSVPKHKNIIMIRYELRVLLTRWHLISLESKFRSLAVRNAASQFKQSYVNELPQTSHTKSYANNHRWWLKKQIKHAKTYVRLLLRARFVNNTTQPNICHNKQRLLASRRLSVALRALFGLEFPVAASTRTGYRRKNVAC